MAGQRAMLAAKRASPRLAPTEKFVPSLWTTSARNLPFSISFIAFWSCRRIASSREFDLLVNSRQSTPSPRSQRLAEAFFATGGPASLTSERSSTPAGRTTSWYAPSVPKYCIRPASTR